MTAAPLCNQSPPLESDTLSDRPLLGKTHQRTNLCWYRYWRCSIASRRLRRGSHRYPADTPTDTQTLSPHTRIQNAEHTTHGHTPTHSFIHSSFIYLDGEEGYVVCHIIVHVHRLAGWYRRSGRVTRRPLACSCYRTRVARLHRSVVDGMKALPDVETNPLAARDTWHAWRPRQQCDHPPSSSSHSASSMLRRKTRSICFGRRRCSR